MLKEIASKKTPAVRREIVEHLRSAGERVMFHAGSGLQLAALSQRAG
jgi:hypothetical protein